MNVVIVDDEMIERKAMKKLIEKSFSEIKVIGEAGNGKAAIEVANELRPDLILMDIKMPGMDGVETVRQIRKVHPGIKFIMVSAYASFQYAKEAMKEGVKEYLVKPSKKEETIETILRVYKELKEERIMEESAKKIALQAEKVSKNLILSKIMRHEMNEETERMMETLFPEIKTGFFHVYACSAPDQLKAIHHVLVQVSPYPFIMSELLGERIAVLYLLGDYHSQQGKVNALSLARTVSLLLKKEGIETLVGIGYPYPVKKLVKSYPEAVLAFNQLRTGKGSLYGFSNQPKLDSSITFEQVFLDYLLLGDFGSAMIHFESYYDQLIVNDGEMQGIRRMREEFVSIKRQLEGMGVYVEDMEVIELDSKSAFMQLITDVSERIRLYQQDQQMISKAKAYIHEHFHTPLSLEEVADYVHLSPTYFTKLFKEKTGHTFIDYLTVYRIEEAKKLLRQTSRSLKDISNAIGYKDPNYFSRVFKKLSSYSPKEYRTLTTKK